MNAEWKDNSVVTLLPGSMSTPSSDSIERRSSPRVKVPLAATVRGVHGAHEVLEVHSMLENVSTNGLYLNLDRPVEYGAELQVVVWLATMPGQQPTTPHVTLHGVVRRVESHANNTFGVAMMFIQQPVHDGSGTHVVVPAAMFQRALPATEHVKVSVVIPTLNEAKNLPHVLPRIPSWVHEVLIVDGCSTDNTVEVARSLREDIRVVYQKRRGKGAALQSGFAASTGDIVVMLDADGSMDPAEIPAFVGALLAGADFAKGSRFLQGGGTTDMQLYRKLGNWGFVVSVRLLFGSSYSDLCYGYNAFWARVLPHLALNGDGFEIETMMNVRALQAGLKIVEVPSFEAERIYGRSNLKTIPDGWRVLKTIVRERFRPHHGHVPTMTEAERKSMVALAPVPHNTLMHNGGDEVLVERAVGE